MTDNRPVLLVTTLAAATALATNRIASVVCTLLFIKISQHSSEAVPSLLRWQHPITFAIATVATILLPYWQHLLLARKSLRASYLAMAILLLLVASPLRLRITHTAVQDQDPRAAETGPEAQSTEEARHAQPGS